MKILVIGTGIIGTIYGWALYESGHEVVHLLRRPRPEIERDGVEIDILDERKGYIKYNKTRYPVKMVYVPDIHDNYDLVIVPTNWYQTEAALRSVLAVCPRSFYYILTSNWNGTAMFDSLMDKSRYILGYPDGGGTLRNGIYWTNIGPEIHISAPSAENRAGFDLITQIFAKADIKTDVQENMLHWLWVHNAGSTAISVAFQKYRSTKRYLRDKKLLKDSLDATRECLKLCELRGAYSDKYPEIAAFKWPMWLLIPMFRYNFRHNESMQRYTAHGESMPVEDIACNYKDILKTARGMHFRMPAFEALEELLQNP
ncbi:MAG: ketopantoate reductase family protein [Lentimicrobium sp.]